MIQRILIPIDGSECSEYAITQGLDFAKAFGAEVVFLHAFENPRMIAPEVAVYIPDYEDELREQADALTRQACARAQEAGVACTRRVLSDIRLVQAILQAEPDVDMIVMGTHGRRGFNRWAFGSVAEEVVRRAWKPCLLVRRNPTAKEAAVEAVLRNETNDALDDALEAASPASDPVAMDSTR